MQRVAPDKIKISIADTYKDKVTFSQVSRDCKRLLGLSIAAADWG
jgi:hypothetical protein